MTMDSFTSARSALASTPPPPPPPDPVAEEKNRKKRKKRALAKLREKYQKEIDQWEHLSNMLMALQEKSQNQQQWHELAATVSYDLPLPSDSAGGQLLDDLLRRRKNLVGPGGRTNVWRIRTVIQQLLEDEQMHGEFAYNEDTKCVGFARLGSEDQMVVVGSMKKLLAVDFGEPLHCLVIVGETHPVEEEMPGFYTLGKGK